MATHNWPLTLPRHFISEGFSYAFKPNTVITQPEVGPVRIRRRSTGKIYILSGQMVMTKAQIAIFDSFYHDTLGSGTQRFNWVNPLNLPSSFGTDSYSVNDYNAEMLIISEAPTFSRVFVGEGGFIQLSMEMYPN